MILAEKIIMLRKKNGWSQEELAMKLDISRQSVSKWESTASVPDLDKIIKLSRLFGVSTDFLLKDDVEPEEELIPLGEDSEEEKQRTVSLEEANEFMEVTARAAKWIAAGVMFCILSPVSMIMLGGFAEYRILRMSEDAAGSIGAIVLFLMIGAAVSIFIMKGMQLGHYDYFEKECFSLEYGVYSIVEKKKQNFDGVLRICIAIGVVLCIFGVIPLFLINVFPKAEIFAVCSVALLLCMVACGVFLFVWSGMIYGSYQKILQVDDYTESKKKMNKKIEALAGFYWCLMTAIYLGISFYTMRWDRTWIIWPCAGVLWAAVCGILNAAFAGDK